MIRAEIVPVGDGFGVCIPEWMLEEAGIEGEVWLRVEGSRIVVEKMARPREGWGEAAALMRGRGEGGLLDPLESTNFDESDSAR